MPHLSSPRLPDYLDSSSLDPLATSMGDENVDPQTLARSSPVKLPHSSPPKGMRVVEDISYLSPHGANRRRSREPLSSSRRISRQNLSPWRIRVTVEAEPEELGIANARTTTRTMKVPLREESPTTEIVKGRGRRSQAGSSGTKRRSTPVRGTRSTSKGRRQSVTDLDIRVLGDEEDFNEWSPQKSRKKAKPRNKKRSDEQSGRAVPGSTCNGAGDDDQDIGQDRNVLKDPGIEVRPDSETEQQFHSGGAVNEDSPGLREIDLNRVSVRSRSRLPKDHKSQHPTKDTNTMLPVLELPTLVPESGHVVSNPAVNGYPTPTSSLRGDSDDVPNLETDTTEHHEGFDTILESEGFTMIDLESIPSVRNFVSPPNERDNEQAGQIETPADELHNGTSLSSPSESRNMPPISSPAAHNQLTSRPTAIPSYLTFIEGESDLSSTVPSSPPMVAQAIPVQLSDSFHPCTKLTPEPYSSPQLPSPPRAFAPPFRPHAIPTHEPTPPRLARVVSAGIALQGVLSPKVGLERAQAQSPGLAQRGPRERLDDLFEGFDSGTRRELRAGLRLGEELAKRQKSSSPAEIEKKAAKTLSNTQVWRGETTVQHTPTPLPADISDMFEKRACPASSATRVEVEAKRIRSEDGNVQLGSDTPVQAKILVAETAHMDTQRKEREWQLEREAVSKQIQNANTSQVIVIDSDGIDETASHSGDCGDLSQCLEEEGADEKDVDETDGDIWLAEAEAHNSSQDQTDRASPDVFPSPEQKRQRERAREVVSKSKRSVIPSPWKRGEDVDGASTFMTSGDVSGLLWKQPRSSARFGAGAIQRQLQGSSDASDRGSSRRDTPIRLRQMYEDPKRASTSPGLKASTVYGECSGETHDDPREQEESQEGQDCFDAANEESGSPDKEAIHESEQQWQENADDQSDNESDSTQDVSSLQPQPIKIPVKFNDSTLSAPPLSPSFQMSTPQSSRPSTPRSALKGSRSSLGLEENNGRKVIFSLQSICVDRDGQESNAPIKSLSPTPPPSTIPGVVELLKPALPPPTLSRGVPEPEPEPEPVQSSWFGWLWSGSKGSLPSSVELKPTASDQTKAVACVDGAAEEAGSGWRKTKSNIRSSSRHDTKVLPSFLRPPSYPSDPCRDVSVPLATTGDFTNVHFRTLHIIYRKSLRPRFHGPSAIRPGLQEMVVEKFTCDEGEFGDFAWEVDRDAVVVLERFMMEVEFGWEGKGHVEWGWTERELCHRLFRIIVGEEVRREQAWRKEQNGGQQKEKN